MLTTMLVEKERKKAEKMKKFQEKQATKPAVPAPSKTKEKKAKADSKDEPLPEYVEETPPGEKKSAFGSWTGLEAGSLLTRAQYSSLLTISSIKPTYPKSWSQRGTHGGKKRDSSNLSLPPTAR